jgi:hypothetical protein
MHLKFKHFVSFFFLLVFGVECIFIQKRSEERKGTREIWRELELEQLGINYMRIVFFCFLSFWFGCFRFRYMLEK